MKRSKRLLKAEKNSEESTMIAKKKTKSPISARYCSTKRRSCESSIKCEQGKEDNDTESVKPASQLKDTVNVINIEKETPYLARSSVDEDDITYRYGNFSGAATGDFFGRQPTDLEGSKQTTQKFKQSTIKNPAMPDLFYQDDDGDTYLHIAVVQCNQHLVRFLIQAMKNVKLDVYNNMRQTPLHLAVITDQGSLVRELIQSGSDINAVDRHGQTPLHLACQGGYVDIVRSIFDCTSSDRSRLKVNAKNFEGLSALHLATISGNREIIGMVISMGADINIKDTSSGRTALHHAVESGRYHVVEYFLSRGANANVSTYSGNTPLHTAAGRQMQEMIQLLSKYGADVNVANREGDKPRVIQGSELGKRQLEASRKRAKRPKTSSPTATSTKKINMGNQGVTS